MKKIYGSFTIAVVFMSFIYYGCGTNEQSSSSVETKFASNHGQSGVLDDVSDKNILQIALGSADHTTLVAAVKAAQLENVLVNPGPLTVFAPTNAAFDKLPAGTVETLLKPENKQTLYQTLLLHAAPGTFYVDKDLKDGSQIYQASGHYLDVEVKDGSTFVNGVKILASVDASNGVIHVIDEVFSAPEK